MTGQARSIVITEDGSQTVFDPASGESFHSRFGARSESEWIFIEAGYRYAIKGKNQLSILEIGFGTGLNALLTSFNCKKDLSKINYVALEAYPLPKEIISTLSYFELIDDPQSESEFHCLHSAHNKEMMVNNLLSFTLLNLKLEDWEGSDKEFDLVYFDAFSPEAQPELWTEGIFRKLYFCMKPGGVLVTYCCKGIVKRALKSAGFNIEKLPGPKGKREILRAIKPIG